MTFSGKFSLLLAFSWLAAITVLLVLPGSAFPSENWMSRIQLDKWVHIFLFALLVTLWVKALWKIYPSRFSFQALAIGTGLLALVYGISMEFVQHYFVENRSFELNDIFADLAGSMIGYLLVTRKAIKK